jgi:hypothetical protein
MFHLPLTAAHTSQRSRVFLFMSSGSLDIMPYIILFCNRVEKNHKGDKITYVPKKVIPKEKIVKIREGKIKMM